MSAFWKQLRDGELEPAERRAFNRWLRTRQPSIEFCITVDPAQVELVVGGESAGIEPLAGQARGVAALLGMVQPGVFESADGNDVIATAQPLTPEKLEELRRWSEPS